MRHLAFLFLLLSITACTNPVNRVTYNNYMQGGMQAEANGDLTTAEERYRRAYINTQLGNLSEEEAATALARGARVKMKLGKDSEAQELLKQAEMAFETDYRKAKDNTKANSNTREGSKLSKCAYNLAVLKRDMCKFDEAEALLQESLAIEREISSQNVRYQALFIYSRVCELAHVNYEQRKLPEAVSYFSTCIEMVDKDNLEQKSPQHYLSMVDEYAQALTASNRLSEAKPIQEKAETLKAKGISAVSLWNHTKCSK